MPEGETSAGRQSTNPRTARSCASGHWSSSTRSTSIKVRNGDTLKSIAREAGLTRQDHAFFNFGTKDPAEIADRREAEVGFTKRTANGKGAVFSDSGSPGILFVPRQWRQPGIATVREHKLRVKPAGPRLAMCLDLYRRPAPGKVFHAYRNGALAHGGRTGNEGALSAPFPLEDRDQVDFPIVKDASP